MGYALSNGMAWNTGYRYIGILQVVLTMVLVFSLPLWKKSAHGSTHKDTVNDRNSGEHKDTADSKYNAENVDAADNTEVLTLPQILKIKGAKAVMGAFFCYCALEQTAILWGSSYLVMAGGLSEEKAASFASLFCIGITAGRGLSGFMTMKFNDTTMIRMGQATIAVGILCILLPFGISGVMTGLVLIGFGCAPIYPCIIHSTPVHFGADKSQAIIGVQMASAYVGTSLMPPLFGLIANHISIHLFPVYLLLILAGMVGMHEKLLKNHIK